MARESDKRSAQSRRSFLKKGGVVAAAGVVGITGVPASQAAAPKIGLNVNRMEQLRNSAKAAKEFAAATRKMAKGLADEPDFAIKVLQNVDSMQLVRYYNQYRAEFESLLGKVDGRTTEGRYVKMLTASELLTGVNSLDGVEVAVASEDQGVFDKAGTVDSVSCSGCDAMGASYLGCCIIHFWGWTSTGSCTPCNNE